MNPLEGLAQYLDRLERRLRLFAWTRGAAAVVGAALILTILIVGALMWSAFTPSGLILGRFVLFLGVGGAIAAMLVVPLMRMNRRRAAQLVEQQHPGFDQRLLTFTERSRDNASDPFLPLLAEDALLAARGAEPEQLINKNRFIRFASLGAVAASVLVWLMFWGPGVFGYGASLLWGSYSKDQPVKPFYSITVAAGFEDDPPQVRSADHRHSRGIHYRPRQCLGAVRQLQQMGRSAHGAGQRQFRFRLPAGARAGRRAVLRGSGRRQIAHVQAPHHRFARGQEHQGHLQLPLVDRPRGSHRRSGRRSARG